MKRKLLIIIFTVFIVFLVSCNTRKNGNIDDNSKNIDKQIIDLRGINPDTTKNDAIKAELKQIGPIGMVKKSYEDLKKQYPNKTILTVWGICPSNYVTDNLNEYLIQNGTDYVVYFKVRTEKDVLMDRPKISNEQEDTRKQLQYQLLETVDILAIDRDNFCDLARKGCFVPWNDYLGTVGGKKLYQVLPENNWKSVTIDGQIYGINGRSDYVYGAPSYIVNKDLMKKYNLTEDDLNKPIYELENIITKVADGEKDNVNFRAIRADISNLNNIQEVSPAYLSGSKAIALYNDPHKEAGIILEEPQYLRLLKSLNQYANRGLIGMKNQRLENFFLEINMSSALPYTNPNYGYYYGKDGEFADTSNVTEIVLDRYYNGSVSLNNIGMYGNCISAKSKNQVDAFDFLNRVYSDPYITNLLLYGVVNKNYIITDGKVDWPIIRVNEDYIGNSYLSYPRFFEYKDKKERYLTLQKSLPYVYYDFYFDPSKVQNEIFETNDVMNHLSELLSGNVKDFDTFIEDLRKQLNNSGVQKLRDEVNRQKEAWLSEHIGE